MFELIPPPCSLLQVRPSPPMASCPLPRVLLRVTNATELSSSVLINHTRAYQLQTSEAFPSTWNPAPNLSCPRPWPWFCFAAGSFIIFLF